MKTIGFELELFVTKNKIIISPGIMDLPHDNNGMLLELRGNPSKSIEEAYYSIFAKLAELESKLKGLVVDKKANWIEKTPEILKTQREYIRKNGNTKDISWENMYNLEPGNKNITHFSAGLHIHLKSEKEYSTRKDNVAFSHKYPELFDFNKDFRSIENEFSKDIKKAERELGFYELKDDGRVEYRSLPASLFFESNFLKRIKSCNLL